jgi:hypothetical protein
MGYQKVFKLPLMNPDSSLEGIIAKTGQFAVGDILIDDPVPLQVRDSSPVLSPAAALVRQRVRSAQRLVRDEGGSAGHMTGSVGFFSRYFQQTPFIFHFPPKLTD